MKKEVKLFLALTLLLLMPFAQAQTTTISDNNITNTNLNNFLYYGNGSQLLGIQSSQIENDYNFLNQTQNDLLYYSINNPYSFYNSTDFIISDYATNTKVDSLGNFSAWSYDYTDLINNPTSLSDFLDDLGDRGYTSLSNFTNDDNYWNDNYATFNETYANTLYSLIGTGSDWNKTYADTLYYSITNPYEFYNSTTLNSLSQLTNDLNIGNWTLDKPNYYIKTEVDTNITNANTSLKNYADSIFLRNDGGSAIGQYDFNGGWTANGLSIINGDLYTQTLYAYNITGLDVSTIKINGSILPQAGFDNQFDLGSSSLRWRDLYLGGIVQSDGTGDNYFMGKVGIGTTSPRRELDIKNGNLILDNGQYIRFADSEGNEKAVLSARPDNTVEIFSGSSALVFKNSGNTEMMRITNTGDLGIGTTAPSQKLDVAGNININEASAYMQDGHRVAKIAKGADTHYANTYVGDLAGSGTKRQTAIGYYAGKSNTGDSQTAIGYYAGQQNKGDYQTTTGYLAGYQNIGRSQTAIGYFAGGDNIGRSQTAIGYFAGSKNTGHQVLAFGYEAAKNNSGHNVVVLGYQAGKDNTESNKLIVQQANINVRPLILGDFSTGNINISNLDVGDSTNYTEIKDNGEISLHGTAKVKKIYCIPASIASGAAATLPNYVSHGIDGAWEFGSVLTQKNSVNFALPYDMDRTENISFKLGWSSPEIIGDVRWQLRYKYYSMGDDTSSIIADETIIIDESVDTTQANGKIFIEIPFAVKPSLTDGSMSIELSRIGGATEDTLNGVAHTFCGGLEYISDKLGESL